ncbi:MAG: hypothetical protein KDI11_09215 [Alphaproteobacteria bacterium]|nr:hypothetical protein [Alphaproteobacteria bacterium]
MSNDITSKDQALSQIVTLARAHDVSLDEIGAHLTKGALKDKSGSWLSRVLGYLGAAFIFGGLALFITMIWDDLNSPARVIITYGPGIVAFILGILVLKDERYEKASTPLFLKSAVLLPTGMFVFLHEYVGGNDSQLAVIIVFGVLALQFTTLFFKERGTVLLFFAYLFFYISIGAFLDKMHIPRDLIGFIMGISIITFSLYLDKTPHRIICPFWYVIGFCTYLAAVSNMMFDLNIHGEIIGITISLTVMLLGWHFKKTDHNVLAPTFYIIGSIGFLYSLFDLVKNTPFLDLSFLAVAVSMMIMSVQINNRALLIISTIAVIGFLGYFTDEYFADVTGWPIALIIFGFFLISVSHYALKLGRRISSPS